MTDLTNQTATQLGAHLETLAHRCEPHRDTLEEMLASIREIARRAQANDALRSAAALPSFRPDCTMRTGHDPLRVELANGPSDDQRGFYAMFRRGEDAARFVAMHNAAASPAAPPTPAAPVTDAEIEAAITALTVDARREADALRVNPEASGTATEKRANRQVQLRALIARRVASAGAAPVDGDIIPLREAFDHLRTAYDALRAEINECHVFLATRGIAPERPLLERIKQCMRPAPVDSEREAKIGAVVRRLNACLDAKGCPECETGKSGSPTEAEETLVDEIIALMRSAPPAPAGDQDAKLREAIEALETVATKQQRVELRDAAHRILCGYSPCTNCGKWAHRSEGHWPCNPIARAAPAASAIAAAPEAPSWTAKMIYATERMSDDAGYAHSECLNHVDINLMDVREFVFRLREQVESHTRRIEALERANNKEAVK